MQLLLLLLLLLLVRETQLLLEVKFQVGFE